MNQGGYDVFVVQKVLVQGSKTKLNIRFGQVTAAKERGLKISYLKKVVDYFVQAGFEVILWRSH
jgi:hypothetical protein